MEAEKAEQEDLNWISAPRLLPPPTERTESRPGRMEEKRSRRKGDAETEDRGGGTQAAHNPPPGKKKGGGTPADNPGQMIGSVREECGRARMSARKSKDTKTKL